MSKECIDCHTPTTTRFSPPRPNLAGEYQDVGDPSHFLGVSTALPTWGAVYTNATAIPGGGTFVNDVWASGGGWSRFGGATGAVAAT